jgi:carotenoid cleavage oxygenase
MTNRFLQGNYAPVDDEIIASDLDVDGTVPTELTGRYVRTGPNPIDPDPVHHHWFLGDGMLHGVRLGEGRAQWYRNRWVDTSRSTERTGRAPVGGPASEFEGSGNTNVVHHAGRLLAMTELSLPYEIGAELETLRRADFGGSLPAGLTAHPKFDPDKGEMHVMAYHFVEPFLRYHVIDADGVLVRTEELAVAGPVMVHDMALTESLVVAFDLPVVFDLDAAMAGEPLPYRWRDDYEARIGLMPRRGTGAETRWVDVDPCYVFHPLNAYDDADRVVIDVIRHDRMFSGAGDGPDSASQVLERWTIEAGAGKVLRDTIDDRPQEFPRADERRVTRHHRFGYTAAGDLDGLGGDRGTAVLKHDLVSRTSEALELGPGRTGGEFVFVPASPDAGEDEGWLLGYVHDAARGASDLVVLDAHDFGSEVARVHLPVRVPVGFHGNWIPDAALG